MAEFGMNAQESNQDVISDIQSLQRTEQGLFNSLETNPNLSPSQQEEIVNKINQITNMRINLYKTLSNLNGYYQDVLKTSHGTLEDQSVAIRIVEDELNQLKQNLRTLKNEKTNKMRLVEINTYYGDKYAEHSNLMKIIIFTLVPVIIITLVFRSGIISQMVYYILLIIVVAIGAYFFWRRFASIITRDAMEYNEYDWFFDPTSAPKPSSKISKDPWLNTDIGTCIGQECCSTGQTYDDSINQCVGDSTYSSKSKQASSSSSSSSSVESMVNHIFTKTSNTNSHKHGNSFGSGPSPVASTRFSGYSKFR
jgi:hypothetical protein